MYQDGIIKLTPHTHTHTHTRTTNSGNYWVFSLPEASTWLLPPGIETAEVQKAEIFISACKPLPASVCAGVNEQSTTCQHLLLKNGTIFRFDMGTFNDTEGFLPLKGINTHNH